VISSVAASLLQSGIIARDVKPARAALGGLSPTAPRVTMKRGPSANPKTVG
jgi:hypothetical protein